MYNVIAEDAIYSKQVPILVRLLKCTHILASFRSPAMLATSCLQALFCWLFGMFTCQEALETWQEALEWNYGAFIIETLCRSKVLNQLIPTELSGAHKQLPTHIPKGPQKGQVTSSS